VVHDTRISFAELQQEMRKPVPTGGVKDALAFVYNPQAFPQQVTDAITGVSRLESKDGLGGSNGLFTLRDIKLDVKKEIRRFYTDSKCDSQFI
jgi:hypothetical protein